MRLRSVQAGVAIVSVLLVVTLATLIVSSLFWREHVTVRWSGLGKGIGLHDEVRALAWDGRVLYMGGAFGRVTEGDEDVTVNGLLAWDSQTDARYLIGDGENVGVTRRGSFDDFAGQVYTLALTDSALYVGGVFDKAGNVAASGVALFDFQRGWQALALGVSIMYKMK